MEQRAVAMATPPTTALWRRVVGLKAIAEDGYVFANEDDPDGITFEVTVRFAGDLALP